MQRKYGSSFRPWSDEARFDEDAEQRRIRESDSFGRETWTGSGQREWQMQVNAMDRQSRRAADFGSEAQDWNTPRQLGELRSVHGQFGEGENDDSVRYGSGSGSQYDRDSFSAPGNPSSYQRRYQQQPRQQGAFAPSQSGWQNRLMGDRWGRSDGAGGGDGYYAEMSPARRPLAGYESNRYSRGHDSRLHGSGSVDTFGGYSGWSDRGMGGHSSPQNRAGPKGYTRPDDRIKDDICECLYHSHELHVEDVSIEVSKGIVTLEGNVPDRRMKHRIEDLVEARIGVKDIDNRIRVKRHDADWGSERSTQSSGPDRHSHDDSARGLFSQGNDASASNGRSSCSSGEPTKN